MPKSSPKVKFKLKSLIPSIRKGPLTVAGCGLLAGVVLGIFLASSLSLGGGSAEDKVTFSEPEVQWTRHRAQLTLEALDRYLGYGRNGQGWRNFLQLHRLQAQLAEGAQADKQELQSALERLSSDHDGLERPPFANVRNAVSAYLKMLDHQNAPQVAAAPQPGGKF